MVDQLTPLLSVLAIYPLLPTTYPIFMEKKYIPYTFLLVPGLSAVQAPPELVVLMILPLLPEINPAVLLTKYKALKGRDSGRDLTLKDVPPLVVKRMSPSSPIM